MTVREFVAKYRIAGRIKKEEEDALLDFLQQSQQISPDGEITTGRREMIRNMIGWILNCGTSLITESTFRVEDKPAVQTERANI